jgi:hypothetical protein
MSRLSELSLRSGDQEGECKKGDFPYMEGHPSRVLIGGSGPPLAQRHIKKGARRGTRTNVHRIHSAPHKPYQVGPILKALKRGNRSLRRHHHRVFHTDTTDSYYDHRRRHVVFFVGSRYL